MNDEAPGSPAAIRRKRWWIVGLILYVAVAAAFSITSRVLDARQKFPTGLTRTIYEGDVSSGRTISQTVTPDIDLAFLDANPALPRRLFSVRWEGIWLRPDARWVDVFAGADDEVVVKLDDQVVIDRNAPLGRGDLMARFLMPEGNHRLEVVYQQHGGDYYLYFGVADAGGVPGRIDAETLFPRRPPARRLRANRNLFMLRRAAVAAWLLPPVLALVAVMAPAGRRAMRRGAGEWAGRVRDGWRLSTAPRAPVVSVRSNSRAIAGLYVLTGAIFLTSIWQFREPQYGFTRFIWFGEQFKDRVLPAVRDIPHHMHEQSGYDGQFYAQLALEPTLRNPDLATALDSFPTRARRILVSWTAFIAGLGRPAWILQAYAVQNVFFWLGLAVLLTRWLPPVDVRHWLAWCGCLLGQGAMASVTLALTDLPSVFLIAAGFAAAESGRMFLAAGILGLSGIARETNLAAAAGYDWLRSWTTSGVVRTVGAAVLIVAPLVLWLLYMQSILGPRVWPVEEGNLVGPFGGLTTYVQRSVRDLQLNGWRGSPVIPGLVAVAGLVVQGSYLLWRAEWHRAWWRVGMAFAALLVLLPFPVYEGNPGAAMRVLLPMTVAFNVMLPGSRWFWPLFVVGNASVLQGLEVLRLVPW